MNSVSKTLYIVILLSLFSNSIFSSESKLKNEPELKEKDTSPIFLKSNVLEKKTMQITFSLLQEHRKNKIIDHNLPMPIKKYSDMNNYIAFLDVSYGIKNNFTVGINLGILFDHYDNKHYLFTQGEKYNVTLFNPELFLKWKAVNSKKSKMNLTVFFGMQPSKSDELFAGQVYQPYLFSSANSFRLGVFMDFPLKRVVFFLNTIFNFAILFPGDVRGYASQYESTTIEDDDKYYFVIFVQTGVHFIASKYFSLNLSVKFVYNSKVKLALQNSDYNIEPAYYFSPGLKINFKLSKNFYTSFSFEYLIYSAINSSLYYRSTTTTTTLDAEITSNYMLYFVFMSKINF